MGTGTMKDSSVVGRTGGCDRVHVTSSDLVSDGEVVEVGVARPLEDGRDSLVCASVCDWEVGVEIGGDVCRTNFALFQVHPDDGDAAREDDATVHRVELSQLGVGDVREGVVGEVNREVVGGDSRGVVGDDA